MKKIWKAIGIILALIAIYVLAQSVVTVIIGMVKVIPIVMKEMASGASLDIERITDEMMSIVSTQVPMILFFSILITVPSYYLIYSNRKQELLAFISVRGIGPVSIPVLIIFGISANFVLDWLLSLASQLKFMMPFFEQYSQLAQMITGGSFILSLLAVGIIGPIFEEILFRGLIFGELRKITKVRAAIFIQAVLFGAFHMNVIQSSYAFLIGILLGYVYYRSNSIVAPAIVHIAINSSTVILGQFAPGSTLEQWGGAIIAASIILFVATGAFVLISRSFRRSMDNSLYDMNHMPKLQTPPTSDV